MENLALKENETSEAQTFEPRKLSYRPHVKWLYYLLLGMSLISESFVLLGVAFGISQGRMNAALAALIGGSIIPTILFLEAWFLFRPLAFSVVQIFPDSIVLTKLNKKIEFRLAEITSVRFSYLPWIGGWFAIVSRNKKPYRFTVVLERSDMILDAIVAFNPNLVDQKRLFNYRKTAIYSDHSWARIYRKLKGWESLGIKYLVFPAAIAGLNFLFARGQSNQRLITAAVSLWIVNLGIGYLFYLAEEIILARRFRKTLLSTPNSIKRDLAAERALQSKIQIVFYAFAATLFVVATFIFRHSI